MYIFFLVVGNYSKALFFSFPLLIMELTNIILFIKTVSYCWKVRNEINRINDTTKNDRKKKYKRDKERYTILFCQRNIRVLIYFLYTYSFFYRLFLILKLSIIMGITFTFEVIFGVVDIKNMDDAAKNFELVWDIINSLQGMEFVY